MAIRVVLGTWFALIAMIALGQFCGLSKEGTAALVALLRYDALPVVTFVLGYCFKKR